MESPAGAEVSDSEDDTLVIALARRCRDGWTKDFVLLDDGFVNRALSPSLLSVVSVAPSVERP